jgi:hypothetical protein
MSHANPLVNALASPPPIGIVYKSPRRSKAMVEPSGETSTFIQVPSVTSIAAFFAVPAPGGFVTSHLSPSFFAAGSAGALASSPRDVANPAQKTRAIAAANDRQKTGDFVFFIQNKTDCQRNPTPSAASVPNDHRHTPSRQSSTAHCLIKQSLEKDIS